VARVSDLTTKRFTFVVAGIALGAVVFSMIHTVAGLAWCAVASALAGLRHRKLLKMRRRRRGTSESRTAPHEEQASPQRRFDTTQINQNSLRIPILSNDQEPIDWRQMRASRKPKPVPRWGTCWISRVAPWDAAPWRCFCPRPTVR